jgi:hypothetical protein
MFVGEPLYFGLQEAKWFEAGLKFGGFLEVSRPKLGKKIFKANLCLRH